MQAIGKDDHNFVFKGQKAVYNKQITTTTGNLLSEQWVKNRASAPLSAWKEDYIAAGNSLSMSVSMSVSVCMPVCVYAGA